MRLGGLVIHGDAAETLGGCLDDLVGVCDVVVAVDSGSTDGSADLVAARAGPPAHVTAGAEVRRVELPWQGYGAARAAGAAALTDCDWILVLDSDERLAPGAAEAIAAWREGPKAHLGYRLPLRDWAHLGARPFRFRTGYPTRLLRLDQASWSARQIVHEAPGIADTGRLGAPIDHRFATSLEALVAKQDRYALLWAVQAHASGRRPKPVFIQRPGHLLRDTLVKGAVLRGGMDAVRLAWAVSRYHALKHAHLAELWRGEHAELAEAYREGRYRALFQRLG